jgi:hypothetical protein
MQMKVFSPSNKKKMFKELFFLLSIQLLKIDGSCINRLPQIEQSTSTISEDIDLSHRVISSYTGCLSGYLWSNKDDFIFNAHRVIFDYDEEVLKCVKIIDYCSKMIGSCEVGIYNYTNSNGCVCIPCYIAPSTTTIMQETTTIEDYNPFKIDLFNQCPSGYMLMDENVNQLVVEIDMLKCPPGFMVLDNNRNKFVVETVNDDVLYSCMSYGHYCRNQMTNLPRDCLEVNYTITNMGGYLDRVVQCECNLMYDY